MSVGVYITTQPLPSPTLYHPNSSGLCCNASGRLDLLDLKIVKINSDGSGMEPNQAEQLDTLLNQLAEVSNKNHETEETDASITSPVTL